MKKILTSNNLFLLAIFCIPLYRLRVVFWGLPTNLSELIAVLAIGISLFQVNNYKKKILELPSSLLVALMFILLGMSFSILLNEPRLTGFGILKGWFLIPIGFSFLLYITMRSKRDMEKVFLSIYLSSFSVALVSLLYKLSGITTYDGRLSAFYLSPNHLAMYLSVGIFFGIYFLFKSLNNNVFLRNFLFNCFSLLIISVSIYYTYSYGAWLAIAFSLFCMTLFKATTRKQFLIGSSLLLIIFAVFFSLQIKTEKFSALTNFSERSSMESRLIIWKVSRSLIAENPFAGIGPGNFQSAYLSLQPKFTPYLEWAVPQPHNVFLAFWLQAGLLGLFGFLMLLFFIFKILWRIMKDKRDAAFAAPLLGFFLYTVSHGILDTTYWKNDLSLLFWICVFIVLFLNKPEIDDQRPIL